MSLEYILHEVKVTVIVIIVLLCDFEVGRRHQHGFFYFVAVSGSMGCFCVLPY